MCKVGILSFSFCVLGAVADSADSRSELCIVGAGPAGLQLGHFFLHAADDAAPGLAHYVIFEKRSAAASFFEKFPIHRSLISLNKRNARFQSREFMLRHDWNSLLGTERAGAAPVTARTVELYPHADVLLQYLRDFAKEQERTGRVHYDSEVVRTSVASSNVHDGFDVVLRDGLTNVTSTWRCGRLVVAAGLSRPHIPTNIVGAQLLLGYEDLPSTAQSFENKTVLILGFGNAAHETAREVQKFTQSVTLLHRRSTPSASPLGSASSSALPRFAFFTHYPGDVRTVTMQLYDTYLLKALDVKLAYDSTEEPVFLPCLDTKFCVWVSKSSRCAGQGESRQILPDLEVLASEPRRCVVSVGAFDPEHPVAAPLMRQLRDMESRGIMRAGRDFALQEVGSLAQSSTVSYQVSTLGYSSVEDYLEARATNDGVDNSVFDTRGWRLELDSGFLISEFGRPLLDIVAILRPILSQDPLRHPFDAAIRCMGWRMDTSFLEPAFRGEAPMGTDSGGSSLGLISGGAAGLAPVGKYPRLDSQYQAISTPGMYFAGALAHGRDFRRGAGGFIHGFRYTARALYRILRREGLGWPNTSFPHLQTASFRAPLALKLWQRLNEASGPYQMFGELADVILFKRGVDGPADLHGEYLEEVPISMIHEDKELSSRPRLLWTFRYGKTFSPLDLPSPGSVGSEFAEFSAFLHPRLELHDAALGARDGVPTPRPRPVMVHSLVEDVFTEWRSHVGHVDPLLRFLIAAVARAGEMVGLPMTRADEVLKERGLEASTVAAWALSTGAFGLAGTGATALPSCDEFSVEARCGYELADL